MAKKILLNLLGLSATLLIINSCSDLTGADGGLVPYPQTPGIIPLIAETRWTFSHTTHSSSIDNLDE